MDLTRSCSGCEYMSPLFSFLTRTELRLIDQNKFTILFRKGETIRKEGTSMTHVISVNSGLAKLYLEGIGSRNTILRIVKPTNFVGGPGIYLDNMHHFSITALQDSIVCFINMETFKKVIENNPAFMQEFIKDFSNNVLSVYKRLISLTQKQAAGRLADSLLYLARDIFSDTSIPSVITKNDIADLSSLSKVSVLQVLRQFQKEELISISRSRITILNQDKLSMISNFG